MCVLRSTVSRLACMHACARLAGWLANDRADCETHKRLAHARARVDGRSSRANITWRLRRAADSLRHLVSTGERSVASGLDMIISHCTSRWPSCKKKNLRATARVDVAKTRLDHRRRQALLPHSHNNLLTHTHTQIERSHQRH